jgi:amidase
MSSPSAYRTATELAADLSARRVGAAELAEQAIARIEALDSRTNAVVVRDFDRARAAAVAADEALARGERKPLLGVPMTVKESFDIAGLPTSWGMPPFKEWRPAADAVAVQRLKAAGAVILGKTNVPYALGDWQSYNEIYGTTNNPWDLGRSPGGSSGGGAAALAAGFSALELGSDIGGSIRVPAHFCGVFGHKPSFGLLPARGHNAPTTVGARDLSVIGPLARSTADLELALSVLAGPDEAEAIGYRLALAPPRHARLADFRVLVIEELPMLPAGAVVRAGVERLAGDLGKAGASVARASPLLPDLAEATKLYLKLLAPIIASRLPREAYDGMVAAAAALAPDDASGRALRLRAATASYRDWAAADEARAKLRLQWRALFAQWDIVLMPVLPTPTFCHDHSPVQEARHYEIDGKPYSYVDQFYYAGIATAPGLPSTAVPIGRSPEGLPFGVQLMGPFLEDRTTLALAGLIEREFGGFVPPPGW